MVFIVEFQRITQSRELRDKHYDSQGSKNSPRKREKGDFKLVLRE